MSVSLLIIEYTKSTQNACICFSIVALMILIFIISPLNTFLLSSMIGKIIIVILLVYCIVYNIIQTNKFAKEFNIDFMSGSFSPIKNNIICSYVFSLLLIILLFSVIRRIFL